jgi:hypothetical protein
MNSFKVIFLALLCALAGTVAAQDTNALKTQIGVFEARTNVVLIKAYGQIGAIALGSQELLVRCKETSDVSTGEKIYGLAIELEASQVQPQRALVDDEEVESLLNAVNYLARINSDATALPGFEAGYTTKSGLRIIAHFDRQDGGMVDFVQVADGPRVALSAMQMTQFYDLIVQGQRKLATLKATK